MLRTTINLPASHRLHLQLVKGRKKPEESSILPDIKSIRRVRSGSKTSRFFKHIFEHQKIKKIIGLNMAAMLVFSSFSPTSVSGNFDQNENLVIETNSVNLATEKGTRIPVNGNLKITQGFSFFHPAIDIDGLTGDDIYPIKNGVIEKIEYSRFAYGNSIIVNHGNGLTSLYAHLSRIYVNEGDRVTTSDVIGEMGTSGRAFGDHLHLEIREDGKALNPLSVLPRD